MAILPLLGFIIVVAALVGVWRARGRGAPAMQAALMLLIVALVAVLAAWYLIRV
jgi:hypothetical protein